MPRLIDADALADELAVLLERNTKLIDEWLANLITDAVDDAPTVDAEPTEEQVKEYCRKRSLVIVTNELFNEMKARWSAKPVRHGRWLDVLVADDEGETDGVEFSECGYTDINVYWAKTYHKFCPNCGAKMDEVD